MAEVIWTKKAFSQFEKEVKFVLNDRGIKAATVTRNKILKSTSLLQSNPDLGLNEPLLAHMKYDYKFLIVWSYKIIYRKNLKQVIISRVFHTSRNPNKLKGI